VCRDNHTSSRRHRLLDLKITIVQGAFLPVPALLGGAVEKVWCALGREFAVRGHEVTHISRRYGGLPDQEIVDGVRHVRIPGFDTPRSLVFLKLLDFLYSRRALRHLPPADVLVTNTFWLPILAREASRGKVYVHVARYPKGQMRFYSRAARLQTVSLPVAEAIGREVPGLAPRIRVIPYPLAENDPAEAPSLTDEVREKHILFVGRIHPEKGVHLLIKAVAALPRERLNGWRLVLAGPSDVRAGGGGEAYLRQLRERATPIADRVDWLGPVFDPVRLASIYRRASIFVYPSLADHGETFGLAPLEAMSHGCATVVSELPCFHDFIQDRLDGLFFNHLGDQPERLLANRLMELMRDEPHRARIGAAALRKAKGYELGRVANLFLEDFRSILRLSSPATTVVQPCARP
jgi:glycosyltransferase involved in cell wall biosynthesis